MGATTMVALFPFVEENGRTAAVAHSGFLVRFTAQLTVGGCFRAASKLSFRKSAKRRLKAQPQAPLRTNGLKTNVD